MKCFGLEFGWTLEESKCVVKEQLGYTYEKDGKTFYKKTSKMDSKELALFIEKFKIMAANQGCELPEPKGDLSKIYNYIEQNKHYLESVF